MKQEGERETRQKERERGKRFCERRTSSKGQTYAEGNEGEEGEDNNLLLYMLLLLDSIRDETMQTVSSNTPTGIQQWTTERISSLSHTLMVREHSEWSVIIYWQQAIGAYR